MRVLAVVRPDALAQPGGDVVHANHALAAVRALGTEVDVAATARPDAAGYDLAHVFGIFEPATARSQIAAIRASGTPLVLSPIWLDLRPFLTIAPAVERALESRDPRKRLLKLRDNEATLVRKGRHARAAERRLTMQRDCMLAADVVLPASNIEAYLYAERLGAGRVPFVVAPLGVDDAPFARAISGERAGILCAARIEPKKNQAALLYA
ncbi:MAG: hypothetical protein GIW95_07620, partial [Candidatus Eremiobacteraeota bacterium]|nr:hypothetical protein [Candidatus Eremiobacteraeota bacterium]